MMHYQTGRPGQEFGKYPPRRGEPHGGRCIRRAPCWSPKHTKRDEPQLALRGTKHCPTQEKEKENILFLFLQWQVSSGGVPMFLLSGRTASRESMRMVAVINVSGSAPLVEMAYAAAALTLYSVVITALVMSW